MAHQAQRIFFNWLRGKKVLFFHGGRVLEVGSLNLNGTVRDFFSRPTEYIGIDLEPGPGVDIVAQGQDFDYPDGYFDVTVSAECFEHNPFWKETFLNMYRMTRDGGLLTFTCASTGREEHGTHESKPEDSPFTVNAGWGYYKNLDAEDFEVFDLEGMFSEHYFEYNPVAADLYFYGIKR